VYTTAFDLSESREGRELRGSTQLRRRQAAQLRGG
jgi:hypothetical protein